MSKQDELYPLTEEELNKAYMGSEYHPSFKMTLQVRHGIERVLAKVKQHYEQKIEEARRGMKEEIIQWLRDLNADEYMLGRLNNELIIKALIREGGK